jgi:hypothetical protein
MVDSHLPRFSQGLQALLLAVAFLVDPISGRWVVVALAVILGLAAVGGPRLNLFAYVYRAVPVPRGEPEPAAPPRFAQTLGTVFLAVASVMLFASTIETLGWWIGGWGPALLVALLAALAATTSL